jgi:hypothetical protein
MHPAILEIAAKVGVPITDRPCDDGHVFDGQSIATHYFPMHWVKTGKKYKWGYPEEHLVRSGEPARYLLDHDLLHEIMHFAVALPEQRDLPEFGLGYTGSHCQAFVPEVVDHDEALVQEKAAQFLCCYIGSIYGISPNLLEEGPPELKEPFQSWELYCRFKWTTDKLETEELRTKAVQLAVKTVRALGY